MARVMRSLQNDLRKLSSPVKAEQALRFFKTAPGEYGEGDLFLGITVPEVRRIAKSYFHLNLYEISTVLKSKWHEERLAALVILTHLFERANHDLKTQKKIVKFYLQHSKFINNWDLVDLSVYKILGRYCFEQKESKILFRLAKSKIHWQRRMSMVATLYFIKKGSLEIAYQISSLHFHDQEDLMHKAAGWMLREAGKKDQKRLEKFLLSQGRKMPRTSVRYAIERFSPSKRKTLLTLTRI